MADHTSLITKAPKTSTFQFLFNLRASNASVNTGLVLIGLFWNNMAGFNLGYVFLLFGVFFANLSAFVVNDFYDASADFEDPVKKERNVFCSDETRTRGIQALFLSVTLSLIFSALASVKILIIMCLFNVLLFLYSAPPTRFRDRLFWDWTFILLWKGLNILAGYVYLFGWTWFGNDPFITGTLSILMLIGLIGHIRVNQLMDFEVDGKTNNINTVQRLGRYHTNILYLILQAIFYGIGVYLCLIYQLYFAMVLILLTLALYYFVKPSKRQYVIDYSLIWIIALFLEKYMSLFNIYATILFGMFVIGMVGFAILHAKRVELI